MSEYNQLKPDETNIDGDRVIYFLDNNADGIYNFGESIEHSAIVYNVDTDGNTIEVIGKMGQVPISINHPDAPGYYETETLPEGYYGPPQQTFRAYFRQTDTK
jgi:hypothetical protein